MTNYLRLTILYKFIIMKNKILLEFNFSLARLKQLADNMVQLMDRDSTQFADRGFTPAKRTAFVAQIDLYTAIRSDEELEGERITAVQLKDQARQLLEINLRTLANMVDNKMADFPGRQSEFGATDFTRQTDDELVRTARKSVRSAGKYLADLADEGLTTAKIAQLETLCNDFDRKIDLAIKAENDRNTATENRHIEANKLYQLLVKYSNTGKTIWADVSEAKYNDYVLYNNSTGSAPDMPPPTDPATPQ